MWVELKLHGQVTAELRVKVESANQTVDDAKKTAGAGKFTDSES